MDGLDILIAQSLQSQWGHREPSPRIWQRLSRRIASLASRFAPEEYPTFYSPSPRRPERIFAPPFYLAGSLVLWRYDPMLMQLV